jgi:hypothetical protein
VSATRQSSARAVCRWRDRRGRIDRTRRGQLYNLCSYLIVEEMRRGKHPKDAGMEALKRVQKNTSKSDC